MTLPAAVFYPPFWITRASHVHLSVTDIARSRSFYVDTIGLIVSHETETACYLRAAEEACHHSLVLEKLEPGKSPECLAIGFRVLTDDEIDKALVWAAQNDVAATLVEQPFQSRTLRLVDNNGMTVELCASMDVVPRRFGDLKAATAYAKRLDHFQTYGPDVNGQAEFYAQLGFRICDAIMADEDIEGVFTWRKGNTHDLVLFNGQGPSLHHFAYTVSEPSQILKACDTAGERGYGKVLERGPGRHPLDGALYLYLRDPDGHRVEIFDGHYQTFDAELTPQITSVEKSGQPWGLPGQASWFEETTPFADAPQRAPKRPRGAPTLEAYLARKNDEKVAR